MKSDIRQVALLVMLATAAPAMSACFTGEDQLQASTAIIDPAIWEALET